MRGCFQACEMSKAELRGNAIDEINDREAFGHWEMDCVVGTVGSKRTKLCYCYMLQIILYST